MKSMLKSVKNPNRGFTLVEVIISIGFLCIACGIIIQLFIASGEVRSKAALREIASLKAANAIEACKISDSPEDIGMEIFNQGSINYEKTEKGYVISEYFSEDWDDPKQGIAPIYVLKINIIEIQKNSDITENFGSPNDGEVYISGLFEINVTAGYVDAGREDSVLAEFSTMHHYVYKEDGE